MAVLKHSVVRILFILKKKEEEEERVQAKAVFPRAYTWRGKGAPGSAPPPTVRGAICSVGGCVLPQPAPGREGELLRRP